MALNILVITANFKRVIIVFAFAPSRRFDNPCDLRASSYSEKIAVPGKFLREYKQKKGYRYECAF